MILAIEELQILHGIFDINDSTGLYFTLVCPGLPVHASGGAASACIFPIPWIPAVREAVPVRFHAPAQASSPATHLNLINACLSNGAAGPFTL